MTRYCVFVLVCLFNLQSCANNALLYIVTVQKWNEIYNLIKAVHTVMSISFQVKTDLEQTQPRLQRIKDDPE